MLCLLVVFDFFSLRQGHRARATVGNLPCSPSAQPPEAGADPLGPHPRPADSDTQGGGGGASELPLTHPSRPVPVGLSSRMTVRGYLAPLPFFHALAEDLVLKNPQIQWLPKISESCEKLLLRFLLLIQNLLLGSKFRIIQVRRVLEALSSLCPPSYLEPRV